MTNLIYPWTNKNMAIRALLLICHNIGMVVTLQVFFCCLFFFCFILFYFYFILTPYVSTHTLHTHCIGIVQRLDYLVELGITTLWITPVLYHDGSYHGMYLRSFFCCFCIFFFFFFLEMNCECAQKF